MEATDMPIILVHLSNRYHVLAYRHHRNIRVKRNPEGDCLAETAGADCSRPCPVMSSISLSMKTGLRQNVPVFEHPHPYRVFFIAFR